MTTSPTALINVADVTLQDVAEFSSSGDLDVTLKSNSLTSVLKEWSPADQAESVIGWYRVTKNDDAFLFESFAGEIEDETTPLVTSALPFGEMEVKADSTLDLLALVLGESELSDGPVFPTPAAVVLRWITASDYRSVLRHRYTELFKRIPSLQLHSAGGMLPFQAEGTIDGLPFYFRYRSDYMSLTVAASERDEFWSKPLYQAGQEYGDGDGYGGVLSHEEFMEQFPKMVKMLKKAPLLWEFKGRYLQDNEEFNHTAGKEVTRHAWGYTAEEAYACLHSMEYFEDESLHETMRKVAENQNLSPISSTVDDRVFPDPEPDFAALVKDSE